MRLLAPEEDLGTIDARVGPACPEVLQASNCEYLELSVKILGQVE